MEDLICKSLINSFISLHKLYLINDALRKYEYMKEITT